MFEGQRSEIVKVIRNLRVHSTVCQFEGMCVTFATMWASANMLVCCTAALPSTSLQGLAKSQCTPHKRPARWSDDEHQTWLRYETSGCASTRTWRPVSVHTVSLARSSERPHAEACPLRRAQRFVTYAARARAPVCARRIEKKGGAVAWHRAYWTS